jgi:nucleolar protein 4
MGLRWLNGHAIAPPKNVSEELKDRKKRLIVEFAIENAQVIKRRTELQERVRNLKKNDKKDEGAPANGDSKKNDSTPNGKKRKRPEDNKGEAENSEEQNKVAKRNRIIAKKRMQRRSRK